MFLKHKTDLDVFNRAATTELQSTVWTNSPNEYEIEGDDE